MNYHNILHDNMLNGDGLRVVLFVSGCDHHCNKCQNPQAWDICSGIEFDLAAKEEIFEQLSKNYISGITFSGGDPLHHNNVYTIYHLILEIKDKFPTKTIWMYTGYTWNEIFHPVVTDNLNVERDVLLNCRVNIVKMCDVLVDGEFIQELADVNYHWAGSTNQRVIDVQQSLKEGKVVLWTN